MRIDVEGSRREAAPVLSPSAASAVRMMPVAEGLWRVIDRSGRVLGHVRQIRVASGRRYGAERFHAPTRMFRQHGEFWSADDAVQCLRYLR